MRLDGKLLLTALVLALMAPETTLAFVVAPMASFASRQHTVGLMRMQSDNNETTTAAVADAHSRKN